ncbi:SMP-30/gluconolactonase/LRE family protein [Massilia violaceinigra]|uniref:SMP-30/gluconolactonase/LRE family protein n=1 Tax=Massilia violaceinigra TaxID=2045208 RepID=A0ABY4AA24_9BURK|nr:SMP-30/gluconolactonase/LRE family protein [Massilia violaceinigra]UOD31656.1 SMP-30/gluconolactonase/LRE family protein [Massilia violaceinigra]
MSTQASIEKVPGVHCAVGESPLWNAREGAWYWVDILGRRIWRLDAASGEQRIWFTAEMPACIALTDSGALVAGMETGVFELTMDIEQHVRAVLLAALPGMKQGMRFNDGRCDRQGRFWSGTLYLDKPELRAEGSLYRYTREQGFSAPLVSNLVVQNGLGFSPDGRTMYLSDSHVARQLIWAFDYDTDSGTPSKQRVLVDMNAHRGRPDGAAVDVDGCYWICGNDGGCLLRFTPEGKLDRTIDLPLLKPSMCSFGGAGMDTLLVTSIAAGRLPEDTESGAVLLVRPGVQGMPETRFRA